MIVLTAEHRRIAATAAKRRAWMVDEVPALSPADLCQAALLGVATWSAAHPGVQPGSALVSQLARWAINDEVVRFRPRRSPRPPCEPIGRRDFPARRRGVPEITADVRDAVASLPPHLRAAAAGWMAGETVAESAAAAGISIRSADYRRSAAAARLRRSLAAYQLED